MALEINYQIQIHARPTSVFPYLLEAEKLGTYWPDSVSSDLEAGKAVSMTWGNDSLEMAVEDIQHTQHIIKLSWQAEAVNYRTQIEIRLEVDDTDTILHIKECGWEDDEAGQNSRMHHTWGWVSMAYQLKARIEHDIDLRCESAIR